MKYFERWPFEVTQVFFLKHGSMMSLPKLNFMRVSVMKFKDKLSKAFS